MLTARLCAATEYATWLMIWIGSDQKQWWKPDEYCGARILVNGKWQSVNWADNDQLEEHLDKIKAAGVTIVIVDLTNGWGWLNNRVQYMQKLCAKKGMKLCVAQNDGGKVETFEKHAADIWNLFAGPKAPYKETYFAYNGKPVIVDYTIRPSFNLISSSTGTNRVNFTVVWASGEDSNANKWGWQLEPWIGGLPSPEAMFVTSSIKWMSRNDEMWRKSLAWLDYNFLLAEAAAPHVVIVGSFDDLHERNSWFEADTTGSIPGRQMRDPSGAVSTAAYYRRVSEWIAETPSAIRGGIVPDGCYRVINQSNSTALSCNGKGEVGEAAAHGRISEGLTNHFWFYHLGSNMYRIISLSSGLFLSAPRGGTGDASRVTQEWDADDPIQKWRITKASNGWCSIRNARTGMAIEAAELPRVALQSPRDEAAQYWCFSTVQVVKPRHKRLLTWQLSRGSEKWKPNIRAAISNAMTSAVALYNGAAEFDKKVTANYNPGTPTADGNYNGWINFGSQMNTRAALHELSHTLGIGQHPNWQRLIKDGQWTGPNALAQLRAFDGPDAVLHADRMHFWPYGLNYDKESSPENDRRHVLMVAALRRDMGIVNGKK